jgi:hypothetical protein
MQYLYSQQPGEVVEKLLYAVGFCGVVADVAGGEGQAYTIASVVLGLVALEFKNPKLFTTFFNFMVLSLLLDVIFLGVWKDRGGGAVAFAALALIGKVRRGCDAASPGAADWGGGRPLSLSHSPLSPRLTFRGVSPLFFSQIGVAWFSKQYLRDLASSGGEQSGSIGTLSAGDSSEAEAAVPIPSPRKGADMSASSDVYGGSYQQA